MDQSNQPGTGTEWGTSRAAGDFASDDLGVRGPGDSQGGSQEATKLAEHAQQRTSQVADTAKDKAAEVKDTAVEAGGDVIDSARQQAGEVISEVRGQSRQLLDEGLGELRHQAGNGQHRLAEVARAFTNELDSMLDGNQQSGLATEFVQGAKGYSQSAADWLENNSPDETLASVRRYAARNPWTFMAIAAGVGFVGARLVRNLSEAKSDDQPNRSLGQGRFGHTGNQSDPDSAHLVDDRESQLAGPISAAAGHSVAGLGYATEDPSYSASDYPDSQRIESASDGGALAAEPWRQPAHGGLGTESTR